MNRRGFLKIGATASGGLLLQWQLPALAAAATDLPGATELGAFLKIEPDGTIIIGARDPEMGQGVSTSLPMIIAEELDASWDQVRVVQLDYGFTNDLEGGPRNRFGSQFAGGSTSIPRAWADLRQAGATARHQLVLAAAEKWEIDATRLSTRDGMVRHPDGRTTRYADLAARAAELPLPADPVPVKAPEEYRLIGKRRRNVNVDQIVRGQARFGIDHYAEGVPVAMLIRSPYLDGEPGEYDPSPALAIPGVTHVVTVLRPNPDEPVTEYMAGGVAIIARDTWAAIKARRALEINWTKGPWSDESTARLRDQATTKAETDADAVALAHGDFASVKSSGTVVAKARYEVPFLAHATMEPQNALLELSDDHARLTVPTQSPGGAQMVIARMTGLEREQIEVRMTRVGGGFGRRLKNDFVAEAVKILQLTKLPAIKLVWTREDDMQHDFYRPFGIHELEAIADSDNKLNGWRHRVLATSRVYRDPGMTDDPIWNGVVDPGGVPADMVPNYLSEYSTLDSGMLRGWWRAPVHTFNAFAIQSFIDEVAHAQKIDPLQFRRDLIGPGKQYPYEGHGGPTFDSGRLLGVLERAAAAIEWKSDREPGRGVGIACHFTFGGYTAHAMEVSVNGKEVTIHRCICAVDVGRVINPLGVDAQMMGGTMDGLNTAARWRISVTDGQVEQSNFHDYPLIYLRQAPDVEVLIIDSDADPSGAGEMGVPTAAPALANAIFAASGQRFRSLPADIELKRG